MIKEIDKPEEPPRIAIKFANTVFILGILFFILLIFFAIYKIYYPPEPVLPAFYIISILSGGVFAALFGLGLKRLGNNLKVNLSVLFFTAGIMVYGFETYLGFYKGLPYDRRTPVEVLEDLNDSGVEAYPNTHPYFFIESNGLTAKKGRIYPLGTISNITTIFDTEERYHPIIETDEHGFNNPKGLYNKNKVDIILIGDSFTEGISVHSNESISAVLRQLDFDTISVGKAGSGSLIELAALKEYAEPLKPKIVLWLYHVNDFADLADEMESSILRKYLNEDDYSQNLMSRQKEIDGVLKNFVQGEWEKKRKKFVFSLLCCGGIKINIKKTKLNLLKLTQLRKMLNLTPTPTPILYTSTTPTPIFRDILSKSKQMVSGWDGKMYFVYLPDWNRYSTVNEHGYYEKRYGKKDPNRDYVMQTATELDIPVIDIHREVFDPHPDPLSLFPLRKNAHYTAEGYRLIAEVIGKRLESDGYVPIKSKK